MTLQKLASEIAKREGKKSQARIGDIREMLKTMAQLEAEIYMLNPGEIGPLGSVRAQAEKLIKKLQAKAKKKK